MIALRHKMPLTLFAMRLVAELTLSGWLLAQFAQSAEIPVAAVVKVQSDAGDHYDTGSGTLIDATADGKSGLVVTCWHVLKDTPCSRIVVTFRDGTQRGAMLVSRDEAGDLAALEIKSPPVPPAAIGEPDTNATIAGFADGRRWHVFTGRTLGRTGGESPSTVIDGETFSGMSGGGVFNGRGQWCGVVWGSVDGESYTTVGTRPLRLLSRLGVKQVTETQCPGGVCRPVFPSYSPGSRVVYAQPTTPAVSAPPASSRACDRCCEGVAARLDTFDARMESLLTVNEQISARLTIVESRAAEPGPPGPPGEAGARGPAGKDGEAGRDAVVDYDAITQRVIAELPPIHVIHRDYNTGETIAEKDVPLGGDLVLRFGSRPPQSAN